MPTFNPTQYPSLNPSFYPTEDPTSVPTEAPSPKPTSTPTASRGNSSPLSTLYAHPNVKNGEANEVDDVSTTTLLTQSSNDDLLGNDENAKAVKNWVYIIVGAVLSLCCMLCVLSLFTICKRLKKKEKVLEKNTENDRELVEIRSISRMGTVTESNINNAESQTIESQQLRLDIVNALNEMDNAMPITPMSIDTYAEAVEVEEDDDDEDIVNALNGMEQPMVTQGGPGSMNIVHSFEGNMDDDIIIGTDEDDMALPGTTDGGKQTLGF